MKNTVLRNLVCAGPAALSYVVLVPLVAHLADRRWGLVWPLPAWVSWLAVLLIPAGAALAVWCMWLFAVIGEGTPNPMAPPARLVVQGPHRYSRNPMMLGGWLVGFGLALALRSPALAAACAMIVAAGSLYVRFIEEPRLRRRFGPAYGDYMRSVPRWLSAPGGAPWCTARH